jgi:anti-anti-sigma factor
MRHAGIFSRLGIHLPPKVEQSGNVRIVTFTADKVRDVENMLARELEGRTDGLGQIHLLLDFTNVEYLNSVELGTLITLHKRMKACGGRLTLFNLSAPVYEVFTVTHLQTLLGICREGTADPAGNGSTTVIKKEVGGSERMGPCDAGDPGKSVGCEQTDSAAANNGEHH